jgi:uncharacterized protein YbaA (DUF1428 family)
LLQQESQISYIDGFVIAVPKGNKQKFIEHAKQGDSVFIENGAKRARDAALAKVMSDPRLNPQSNPVPSMVNG